MSDESIVPLAQEAPSLFEIAQAINQLQRLVLDLIESGSGGGGDVTWNDVENKPSEFPPSEHTHDYSNLENLPSLFSGNYEDLSGKPTLFSGNYEDLNNLPSLFSGDYSDLVNVPESFTPSAHTHNYDELENLPNLFSGNYGDLVGVPSTFPPSAHVHSYDDLENLPTLFSGSYDDLENIPTSFPPSTHSHGYADLPFSGTDATNWTSAYNWGNHADAGYLTSVFWDDVENKPTLFSGSYEDLTNVPVTFPPSTHFHSYLELEDIPSEFPPSSHTHLASEVTEDSSHKFVTTSQITEWDAKVEQTGTYPNLRAQATTKADVGLGNVDNTSDANKPVSTAQQAALNLKVSISDIVDNLTTQETDQPLSAKQGYVLKGLIDTINTVLQSNDGTLDTLQEIVDFIQLNRDDLENLSIASIAGLQTALDSKLTASSNLSDVASASTSRTNLGLGNSATLNVGTSAGTVAAGNDSRFTNSREWIASTVPQAEAEDGTATTRRAWTAQRDRQATVAWWNASAAKTKLDGIDTGATANSSDATLLARANHTGTQAATTITQTPSYRFVTDTEKATWNAKGSSNLALGTTSSTAFRGDYGNTAYTHSQSAHAPSNAQKNSDITKSEIEAKLTGTISSHTHAAANIVEDTSHQFVTAAQKIAWGSKAEGSHTHNTQDITPTIDRQYVTDAEKTSLSFIANLTDDVQQLSVSTTIWTGSAASVDFDTDITGGDPGEGDYLIYHSQNPGNGPVRIRYIPGETTTAMTPYATGGPSGVTHGWHRVSISTLGVCSCLRVNIFFPSSPGHATVATNNLSITAIKKIG